MSDPAVPAGLDPGIASYLEALASRTEANITTMVDKRFCAFETRVRFLESEVKASKPPPSTSTPPVAEDLPPILLPGGGALINGSLPPPSSPRGTLVHRTDALERKLDRLLKAHGVQPNDVGSAERFFRWVASPEGRKQLGVLVAAVAAIYAAIHGAPMPAPTSSPAPSPPSLPMPHGSG
jgi:hypothetical protein